LKHPRNLLRLFAAATALLTCALVAVNLAVMNNNESGFNWKYASYASLYFLEATPRITNFKFPARGQLQLQFSRPFATAWRLSVDGAESGDVVGASPSITLAQGAHDYLLRPPPPAPAVELRVSYTAQEDYAKVGNSNDDNYFLIHSSLPIAGYELYSPRRFIPDLEAFPPRELEQARDMVFKKTGISPSDGTEARIRKLVVFLLDKLEDKGGIPSDGFNQLSPFQQFAQASGGGKDAAVWCGNYAEIYVFFANLAGVPTRKVVNGGRLWRMAFSGHSYAESYVAERNQWAQVDLSSLRAFVKNDAGDFMNAADLMAITETGAGKSFTSTIYNRGELLDVPYLKTAKAERQYFNREAVILYHYPYQNPKSAAAKFMRYLARPDLAYSLKGSNAKYYLKAALLGANALAALACLAFLSVLLAARKNQTAATGGLTRT